MKILIKQGRVIDPANQRDEISDIFIANGKITKISKNINCLADQVITAQDKIVIAGLIDMHVHLREPGREDKETVASATAAALKGGVTTVLAMPNTRPPIDCPENLKLLQTAIQNSAQAQVLCAGTITKKRQGQALTDIARLKKAGVVAISDDGASVDNTQLLLQALKTAKRHQLLVICHCEDKTLSTDGEVNLGITSTRMGLRGISKESEYLRVQRDIELAQEADAPIHIAHLSCAESVEIVAAAKKKGIRVTCETAPHYFTLCDQAVLNFDTNMKVNPPLRSLKDMQAIKQGLKNGVIDVIASDHAPHTENEKDIEFERAEFGAIGLETELSLGVTELVEPGILSWLELLEKMALNPARILGIDRGTLSVGAVADLVIVAPQKQWQAAKKSFLSKSKNSPFIGCKLKGLVEYTIYGGKIVYR